MLTKGHLRAALALTAIAITAVAGTAAASARSLVVKRLTLDAYSPGTAGHGKRLQSPRLTKGKLYVVTVQGTVSFYAAVDYLQIQKPFTRFCGRPQTAPLFGSAGGSGPVSNDAEFIFAQPVTTGGCQALKLPVAYPNFQVDDGFGWGHPQLLSPKPLHRPTANHAYHFAIVGQGKRLGLELVDPDTRDDYGSFRITVRRALASDCSHGQWRAFGLKRAAICGGDTAGTQGVIPKLARAKPLKLPQTPIAHVVRDSDFPTAMNAELPAGALTAKQFSKYATSSAATAKALRTILTAQRLRSAAITRLTGTALPTITSTAMQFNGAAGTKAAFTGLVALDAGSNTPTGTTAKVTAATGVTGDVITYSGTTPGVEVIARAGTSVYALRELQTAAGGPVSAKTATTLLAALITR